MIELLIINFLLNLKIHLYLNLTRRVRLCLSLDLYLIILKNSIILILIHLKLMQLIILFSRILIYLIILRNIYKTKINGNWQKVINLMKYLWKWKRKHFKDFLWYFNKDGLDMIKRNWIYQTSLFKIKFRNNCYNKKPYNI